MPKGGCLSLQGSLCSEPPGRHSPQLSFPPLAREGGAEQRLGSGHTLERVRGRKQTNQALKLRFYLAATRESPKASKQEVIMIKGDTD